MNVHEKVGGLVRNVLSAMGLTLSDINVGKYGVIPERGGAHGSMAPRGCEVPAFSFVSRLPTKIECMSENRRIDELRRRVDKDPSSIAFAQLAEEYRRIGDYVEAVKICRDGLERHPGYLSAHVTLGRALVELRNFDEARIQLEAVLKVAPDNLAAIRALADIHQQTGEVAEAVKAVPVPREAPVAKPTTPAAPVEQASDLRSGTGERPAPPPRR